MNATVNRPYITLYVVCLGLLLIFFPFNQLIAQDDDTAEVPEVDSFFLLKSKGLLGRLARSIVTDTVPDDNLVRLDRLYRKYKGRVIRNIEIRRVDFGIPINDTTRSFKNTMTRWADALHHTTRENVIRNNLFFEKGDRLLPILLADNERHLRDQAYLNDVKIIVKRVIGTRDSVDVIILTKDVLSIGGQFRMSSHQKVQTTIREDNFGGRGDKLQAGIFYDHIRHERFGFGAEYVIRNIGGSFIDAQLGLLDYAPTFNTNHRQEKMIYGRLVKPLVNPYMKWTYALEAAWHRNDNMYFPDTTYLSDNRYQYYNYDAWIGLNLSARKLNQKVNDDRLRNLIGLRLLHQAFQKVPTKYETEYFYQYADLTGILASYSIFRQDFYKTQYVYGFGRNEDVPEGVDATITTGWTNKNKRIRPYLGLDLQYNHFTKRKHYFNYTLRLGGYSYQKSFEDISILGNVEFFTRLRNLNSKWKQRTFITAGITSQVKRELNEPLFLESQFGLPEYENIYLGGDLRLTAKAESVFFSPWSVALFRFAPFVFGNATILTPQTPPINRKLYTSLGAGIRSRNESLVFGTLELRTFFFPRKNFDGSYFRVEFNSNIKFKYNNQFIRRPQFTAVN